MCVGAVTLMEKLSAKVSNSLSKGRCLMDIYCRLILHIGIIITMASGDLSGVSEVKDMAVANTHFTFDLLRGCGSDLKGQNFFFAPYSISTALAMTYIGARDQTAHEMKQVLKWSSSVPTKGFSSYLPLLKEAAGQQTPGYVLMGAQRIYVDKKLSLKPEFSSATQQHFDSQASVADFQRNAEGERKSINSWVSDQTRAKIQELLPAGSIDSLTAMVLVQALYFKGNWKHKFDAKRTQPAEFFSPQGTITVSMMEQTRHFNYGISREVDCAAIELPYASNSTSASTHDLSMLILLPNDYQGLDNLEASLTQVIFEKIRSSMRSLEVDLKLPRFSVESSIALKKVLTSLGMGRAFGEDADFTGMVTGPLAISEVYHKAVLEINEEGSEAAAATTITMTLRSLPVVEPFIADHPFLLFIIDNRADVILFCGRVTSPTPVSQSQQKEEL